MNKGKRVTKNHSLSMEVLFLPSFNSTHHHHHHQLHFFSSTDRLTILYRVLVVDDADHPTKRTVLYVEQIISRNQFLMKRLIIKRVVS